MDQQAFAQLLGNYGEFLGAIAVAVNLVYLSAQVRQNTQATRAQTVQDSTGSLSKYLLVQAHSDALGVAWSKGAENGYASLHVKDEFHVRGFISALLYTNKNAYDQLQLGTITDAEWNEYRDLLIALLRQWKVIEEMWNLYKHFLPEPFVEAVESNR